MQHSKNPARYSTNRHFHPHHPPIRRVIAVIILGALGFIGLAFAVQNGMTLDFDRLVLLSLRDPNDLSDAWGPPWFEEAAAEITALGGYTILVTLAAITLAMLWLLHKRAAALFLLIGLGSGTVLSTALKYLFARPRPDLVDHLDRTFTSSFPSGHATVSMVAYLTLAAVAIRFVPTHRVRVFILVTAILLAFVIGMSRVYLGVHWPSDVVAGWCIGAAWAALCWLIAHYLTYQRPRDQAETFGHSET